MGGVDRLLRVNSLIKRELADLLSKELLPGASKSLVSVTEVNTSSDLHNATVYISVFGPKTASKNTVMRALESRRFYFQSQIGNNLKFKYTPVLLFKLDERTERGDRVLTILNVDEE